MTSEKSDLREVRKLLVPRETYTPYPRWEDRRAWEAIPEDLAGPYLSLAEQILSYDTSALTATKYLAYARSGGVGSDYGSATGPRRQTLKNAVLCECLEGKGRFLDKIVDLIWAICEESSWIPPAHNNHMHGHMETGIIRLPLPDVTNRCFVDLISSGTAGLLAWTAYLLKTPLDGVTPMVCERIEHELTERIFRPFLAHDDMTWYGFYGHKINNWNPFILHNILCADLLCVKDPDLRAKIFSKALEKLDIYIRQVPEDGGCDEGPAYWDMAGGAIYDCFSAIRDGTGGKLDFFREPLTKRMAEYIAKACLSGTRFANFADNGPHTAADPRMLRLYGEAVDSDYLKAFALTRPVPEIAYDSYVHFTRELDALLRMPVLPSEKEPFTPGCFWLPQTEVFFGRDLRNEMQLAMKGGFNNESHNHNDLGHFILLWKGEPVFPDLGHLPYTAKTFSPFRYEIWILTSVWHSCASVNGYDQHNGDDYRAEILEYRENGSLICLSMELKGAYAPEAGIESYVRSFVFDRASQKLTVTDTFRLRDATADVESHYVTIAEPEISEGCARIPAGKDTCILRFDGCALCAGGETHDLEADALKKAWGAESCHRILLRPKKAAREIVIRAEITMEQSAE